MATEMKTIDGKELAAMSHELSLMQSETEASQAAAERYRYNIADMMRENKDDLTSFHPVRYKIKRSFWKRIADWLNRLRNII